MFTGARLIRRADCAVTAWSGGTTAEIAIAPRGAAYADRDFLWRISSAVVDLERSDFTPLPGYDRVIVPLDGSIALTHDGGPEVVLDRFEPHAFNGASATTCRGRCVDFNLMTRQGRCQGAVSHLHIGPGSSVALSPAVLSGAPRAARSTLFFLASGDVICELSGSTFELADGDSLMTDGTPRTSLRSSGGADIIVAVVAAAPI